MAANPCFAGAGPDDVGVRRRNRERADRGNRLVVEDRLPMDAAVSGLENTARSGAGVVDVGLADDSCDCADSIADWTDVTIAKRAQCFRVDLLSKARRERTGRQQEDHSSEA